MGITVLGPIQVDGQENGISPRDRVVLSALVVRAGEPITTEALADALWGDSLPPSWAKVLQGCVVRLRKLLGSGAIQSTANGYRLALTDEELDHRLFERLLDRGRAALAEGDPERSSYLVQEALQLWRGPALPDLEDWAPGRVETARLEGLRMDAEELLVEAATDAGRAHEVLERARALVARAPFRERRWALLARVLHQSGRQPEALEAIKRARSMLVEEFGLDPGRELVELEALLLRQDPSLAPTESAPAEILATCPYRGLLPYEAADADSFFGREDDISACLRRLRDTSVLAVVGPSGVGKSSLVRAGVVASLERSGLPVLVTMPGVSPLDSLARLKQRGRQTLVVDQAEEAVTLCTDPSERARYFARLALHVGSGGRLVLALRADHLGDLAPYPEIARVLEDGLYLLGPMSEAGLRSAIQDPARRAGLRIEPGLVDLLIRDVEGEPAALPLLSHVLRETWVHREGPTLTVAGYRATGGIRQAVAQTAEALYDAMDATQRGQLRSLLLRLVLPTEDGDPVRAGVPRTKVAVDAAHERLVERLVEARLVSIDDETVQIAHEALVRKWPRLRGWLDDDLDGQRLFRHLAGAADAWEAMGRPDSELYRGTRLTRSLEWRDRASPDLNDTETAFLDASVALSRAEQRAAETRAARERRSRRRLRGALAGVGVFLVLALMGGFIAMRAADQAAQEKRDRQAAATLAEARRAGDQALVTRDTATALLLALEADTIDTSELAQDNLGAVLTRAGPLDRVRGIDGQAVTSTLSPDGRTLAVSLAPDSNEPGIHLYDAATLEPLDFPTTMPSSIIRFSPDGHQLAMAVNQWVPAGPPRLADQPIQFYNLPGGTRSRQQLGGWRDGDSIEYAMEYSDDGRRLAAVVQHWDRKAAAFTPLGKATVWDLAHPTRPIFSVQVPEYTLVDLSPDGSRLYLVTPGEHNALRSYNMASGRLINAVDIPAQPKQDAGGIDLSPDSSTLAVTSGDHIRQYDAATLRRRGPEIRGPDLADGGRYSHDGRFLLIASADESVIVWDADTGALMHRFATPGGVWGTSTSWSPDDRAIYATALDVGLMKWRLPDASQVLTLGEATPEAPGSAYDLSLAAPDGHTLLRVQSGRLWFVDLRTGRETPGSVTVPGVWDARWSPDGRWLLTIVEEQLRIWDPTTGRLVGFKQFPRGGGLHATFSADGERMYVVNRTGQLQAFDRETLRPVGPAAAVGTVTTLGARGDIVIVLRLDGSVIRVRPETGEVVGQAPTGTLSNTEDAPNDASPDGTLLATADAEGRMRLLNLKTLEWLGNDARADTLADAGEANGGWVAFAPDGTQFAALQSNRIGLWDGHTGAYQGSLPLPEFATGGSIRYLPDRPGLLFAARDGRTWTADTDTDSWAEHACSIAGRNLTQAEWQQYFPSRPYHVTCPQWPAGS